MFSCFGRRGKGVGVRGGGGGLLLGGGWGGVGVEGLWGKGKSFRSRATAPTELCPGAIVPWQLCQNSSGIHPTRRPMA